MKAVMVDIETLDLLPSAVLLSVGAVEMDFDRGDIASAYYCRADRHTQLGRTVGEGTWKFWQEQDSAVREEAFTGKTPLTDVLTGLNNTLDSIRNRNDGDLEVWSSAQLDFYVLEDCYRYCNLHTPWRFNEVRCYRTMREQFRQAPLPDDIQGGHRADVDALWQAQHLLNIRQWLVEHLV